MSGFSENTNRGMTKSEFIDEIIDMNDDDALVLYRLCQEWGKLFSRAAVKSEIEYKAASDFF